MPRADATPAAPVVYPPTGSARGLLLVLHGRTGRLPHSARPWKPASEAGFVVAVPCSSRLSSSDGTFDWPEPTRALEDVRSYHAAVASEHGLHGRPLVLGGVSQGARMAMGASLAGALPAMGFVAVCPVMRDRSAIAPSVAAAAERGTRGVAFIGQWDWAGDETEAVCRELQRDGVDVESHVMKGVDHGYPLDFDERLTWALDFVLSRRG